MEFKRPSLEQEAQPEADIMVEDGISLRHYYNKNSGRLQSTDQVLKGPEYEQISAEQAGLLREVWRDKTKLRALRHKCRGEVVHVIGNGPSVTNTKHIIGNRNICIGVNGAFLAYETPDYWICLDELQAVNKPIRDKMKEYFLTDTFSKKLLSRVAWINYDVKEPDYVLDNGNWDFNEERLSWCGSSCHAALHLALYMGAAQVILHGLDYTDRTHFYNPEIKNFEALNSWPDIGDHIDGFMKLANLAKKLNIPILNANDQSKLKVFPFMHVDPPKPEPKPEPIPEPVPEVPKPDIPVAAEINQSAIYDFSREHLRIDNGKSMKIFPFEKLKKDKKLAHLLHVTKTLKAIMQEKSNG